MKILSTFAATLTVAGLLGSTALAQETNLRIQTHHGQESPAGKLMTAFVDKVETMSNGEISIEMFYSSSVVKSAEAFDAAVNGILDCDMTTAAYQTGKNSAFQFVSDIMGAYETPYQQLSWLYYGGGFDAAQQLYNGYGMQLVGWSIAGQESLSSTSSLAGVADLADWKFRSPPGMETRIFQGLGASPIVMDFTEVFTAMETGIIEGADAAVLSANQSLGLYDIAKHATFPGFHSMPSDHLACNLEVWNDMPVHHQTILSVAMESHAFQLALTTEQMNNLAATELRAQGVTLHAWSAEDLQAFRSAAQAAWPEFADTPEAEALLASHLAYLELIGFNK